MKKITLLAMSFMMALMVKAQDAGTDITSQFTNTDFEAQNVSGWTTSGPANADGRGAHAQGSAADNNYQGTWFMEAWNTSGTNFSKFDWSQTIEVPNGYYAVKALAHAIQQKDGSAPTGVYVYAEDVKTPVTTTTAAEYSVFANVTDGTLTIGYCGENTNVNWAGCDYFRVIQCHGDTEDAAKTSWLKYEMLQIQEDLEANVLENAMDAALRDALYEAFGAIESVSNYAEAEALWNSIKEMAEEAKECVAAYEKLIAKIDEVYEYAEDHDGQGDVDILFGAADAAQEGYDDEVFTLAGALAEIEALNKALYEYNLSIADGTVGFDVTEMYVVNPSVRKNLDGWKWDGAEPGVQYEVQEFYNCDFNFYQTITGLRNGKYVVKVQGFYRAAGNDSGAAYANGTEKISAVIYANDDEAPMQSLYSHTASEMGVTVDVLNDYVNMRQSANMAFNTVNPLTGDLYYTESEVSVIVMDGTLTFGLRNVGHAGSSWCAFREFKLEYYGNFPGINLYAKMQKIEETMTERYDEIPSAERKAMNSYLTSIRKYTNPGYSEEEVNAVILELDSRWARVEKAMKLYAELQALLDYAENELLDLDYPGVDALFDLIFEAYDCFDEDLEQNTNEELLAMKEKMEEGIADYIRSQEASEDVAADYNYFVPNPNFEEKGEWTWSVVGGGTDQWNGGCRPTEEGGANRQGVNLWGWGITSVDVHQTLTGLPNGLYKVSAELITQAGYATDQHVYAIGAATVTSENLQYEGWDTYEWTTLTTTDYAVVIDGTLTIGAASSKGGTNSEAWFQATNFQLYYYGEASVERLQAAWESLEAQAIEAVDFLIPNEEKAVAAALEAATPKAAAGDYVDACNTLRPVIAEWDSIIVASKNFYGGYYAKLDTIRLYDAYEGCEMVYEFADAAVALADAILESDTASCKIFPGLDAKLHSYANYAAALRDAENEMKNEEAGYEQANIDFLKTQVIDPQLKDLTVTLCNTADCDAATAVLKKATIMLQNSTIEFDELEEGDVTHIIKNADVEADLEGNWIVVQGGAQNYGRNASEHYSGVADNDYLDAWHPTAGTNTATFYQEFAGIPDGTYRLVVAARTDGNNVWLYAATTPDVKDESTQFVEVKKYGAWRGDIWAEDSLAWEAAGRPEENMTEAYPYFMARYNSELGYGEGYGWSWHEIEVEVTNRYLAIGISANAAHTGKNQFTGTWFGADDWSLELVKKNEVQGEYNPFLGVENVEVATPVVQGIYDLFGRRFDAITAPGLYIVNGKKVLVK